MIALLTPHMLLLFGAWALGAGISLVQRPWIPWLIAVPIAFGALFVARFEWLKFSVLDAYLIALGYAVLIVSLNGCEWSIPLARLSRYLADFSYSVYLIHFPVILFTVSLVFTLLKTGIRLDFSIVNLGYYSSVLALSIFVSWAVALVTERKTPALRHRLYLLFNIGSPTKGVA